MSGGAAGRINGETEEGRRTQWKLGVCEYVILDDDDPDYDFSESSSEELDEDDEEFVYDNTQNNFVLPSNYSRTFSLATCVFTAAAIHIVGYHDFYIEIFRAFKIEPGLATIKM